MHSTTPPYTHTRSNQQHAARRPAAPTPEQLSQLEAILLDLITLNEQLVTLAAEHRDAIASAKPARIQSCMLQQNDIVQQIAETEKRRLALTADICQAAQQEPAQHTTIATIAQLAPNAIRERLLAVAGRLKDVLLRLRSEQSAIRQAAQSLNTHIEGIMAQISRQLSHAGTYSRTGSVDASVKVVSALDIHS